MKLFSFILFSILILNIFAGCKSSTDKKPETTKQQPPPVNNQTVTPPQTQSQVEQKSALNAEVSKEIIAVIKKNMEATEKKDKQAVLNTIHKDSPQRESTIKGLDFVFKQYNFHFQLDDVRVLEVLGDSAVVYFKQTTIPVGKQQGVSANTAEGFDYMKKEGNEWKIYSTRFLNTEYK